MSEEELLKLKKKVSKAKERKLELQGELKSKQAQLAENFDCNSKEEAIKKRDKLEKEASEIDAKIEKGVKKIKKILANDK